MSLGGLCDPNFFGGTEMVNIYQCVLCGHEWEIPADSADNENITVTGICYVDGCSVCVLAHIE